MPQLQDGYDAILSKRACSPKTEAIRSATADLLLSGDKVATSIGLQPCGAKEVAVRRTEGRRRREGRGGEGRREAPTHGRRTAATPPSA